MVSHRIFVLVGPTAVGKGTVVRRLLERYPSIYLSVSATTRAPRPGEVDGVHYHFFTHEEFDATTEAGEMLEWALVHGVNKYGTPRKPVEEAAAAGKTVLLEIDLAGARQIRTTDLDAYYIFLAPPSWEELERRLIGRGTESQEEQERRLRTARTELVAAEEFDEIVINDDLETTVTQLAQLMGLE